MSSDSQYTIFTKKLGSLIGVVCSVSVLFLGIFFVVFYSFQLRSISEVSLRNSSSAISNSLNIYLSIVSDKLKTDLILFQEQLNLIGPASIDLKDLSERVVVNQNNSNLTRKLLPQLKIGSERVDNNLPRGINNLANNTASIFQFTDDKLLKVAYGKSSGDNIRDWNVFFNNDTAVYKSLLKGEDFMTKSKIKEEWFVVRFTPLRNIESQIIGALAMSYPLLNNGLKNLIDNSKNGEVCFHIYDGEGNIIIHPEIKYNAKLFDLIPEFKGRKEGIIYYSYDKKKRTNYVSYLKDWDLYTGLSVIDYNIIWKNIWQMLIFVISIWLIIIGVVSYIIYKKIGNIEHSIDDFREKIRKVSRDNDYTVTFSEEEKLDEYETNIYLNEIVHSLKKKEERIITSSHVLNYSAEKLKVMADDLVKTSHSTIESSNKGEMLITYNKLTKDIEETGEKMSQLSHKIGCFTRNF